MPEQSYPRGLLFMFNKAIYPSIGCYTPHQCKPQALLKRVSAVTSYEIACSAHIQRPLAPLGAAMMLSRPSPWYQKGVCRVTFVK